LSSICRNSERFAFQARGSADEIFKESLSLSSGEGAKSDVSLLRDPEMSPLPWE
jgi:hypothetical protein